MVAVEIDHLVLVARDVDRMAQFYRDVLGAEVRDLEAWHTGAAQYPVLQFDGWKINLHPIVTPATPRAAAPVPGSLDLCLRWPGPISAAAAHLRSQRVAIELGPVPQEGARGAATSVYFRDPDNNLLELISYELDAP